MWVGKTHLLNPKREFSHSTLKVKVSNSPPFPKNNPLFPNLQISYITLPPYTPPLYSLFSYTILYTPTQLTIYPLLFSLTPHNLNILIPVPKQNYYYICWWPNLWKQEARAPMVFFFLFIGWMDLKWGENCSEVTKNEVN